MADETSQEEPSMEEILASIRRIISEDGEEEGEGAAEAGADGDAVAAEDGATAGDGATAADGGAAEEVAAEAVAAEAPSEEAGAEEVLELTEEVDAQGNVVAEGTDEASAFEAAAPAAIASSTPDPVVDMSDSVAEPLTPVEPASTLMENVAEGAAAGAFAALASQIGPGQADNNAQQVTPGGRTIEDHVLEMLRPMLREWLDKHLPQMVQRLVQREIDRIIHRSDPV